MNNEIVKLKLSDVVGYIVDSDEYVSSRTSDIFTYNTYNGKNEITLEFKQFKLKDIINGKEIGYNISIPIVYFDGNEMYCVLKLNTDAHIGIAKYINNNMKLSDIKVDNINYRFNLLLTSFKSLNLINVLTDRKFIFMLKNEKFVNKLKRDRLALYKLLIKTFNYEVNKYTRINKIRRYGYQSHFNFNKFNILNIFNFQNNNKNFLHVTFCINSGIDNIYDSYIRGFNFMCPFSKK